MVSRASVQGRNAAGAHRGPRGRHMVLPVPPLPWRTTGLWETGRREARKYTEWTVLFKGAPAAEARSPPGRAWRPLRRHGAGARAVRPGSAPWTRAPCRAGCSSALAGLRCPVGVVGARRRPPHRALTSDKDMAGPGGRLREAHVRLGGRVRPRRGGLSVVQVQTACRRGRGRVQRNRTGSAGERAGGPAERESPQTAGPSPGPPAACGWKLERASPPNSTPPAKT